LSPGREREEGDGYDDLDDDRDSRASVPAAQTMPPESWTDAQKPETMHWTDGTRFNLRTNQWMAAIQAERAAEMMEDTIGNKLTEATAGQVVKTMTQMAKGSQAQHKDGFDESLLTPQEAAELQRLRLAMESKGAFDTKSYLGNQFRKFLAATPSEKAKYHECGNRQEQAAFRAEWVAKSFKNFVDKKQAKRAWSRTDVTKGRWVNFGRLVIDLGGWTCREALEGAVTACQKCLQMGGSWIRIHPQTNLVEFLILKTEWTEEFVQSWEMFREYWGEHQEVATVAAGTETQVASCSVSRSQLPAGQEPQQAASSGNELEDAAKEGEKEVAEEPKKTNGRAKAGSAKGKKRKGEEEVAEEPKKTNGRAKAGSAKGGKLKGTTDLDSPALWREGNKLRARFQAATAAFMELHDKILKDKAWAWAQATELPLLMECQETLKAAMTGWQMEYVVSADTTSFKRDHATAKCDTELVAFLKLSPQVDELAEVAASILRANRELRKRCK